MFEPCSLDIGQFRLVLLHADRSNRVRLQALSRPGETPMPAWRPWSEARGMCVCGYGPGMLVLSWHPEQAHPGSPVLRIDAQGRLNLGLLPRHVGLDENWLVGISDIDTGHLILLDHRHMACALAALCCANLIDAQAKPALPMPGSALASATIERPGGNR